MTRKKFLSVLLLSLAIAVFTQCKDEPPEGPAIQPGVGLNDLKIGDTADDAFKVYGPTTDTYVESNGQYIHLLNYESIGVLVLLEPTNSPELDKNTKILSIGLDSPYTGKTAENLGIGSTKTEVRTAYGQPELADATTDTYKARGISFSYDAAEKTESIIVKKF